MHTAAILGNMQQEGNFSPTNAQDSYGYPGNINPEYMVNYKVDDGVGWGLVQWTYYTRKQGLLDYATNLGTSVGDMVTQLEYLHHELRNVSPYNSRYETFLQITDIDDATQYFCEQIEQAGISHMTQRQKYARDILEEFTGN